MMFFKSSFITLALVVLPSFINAFSADVNYSPASLFKRYCCSTPPPQSCCVPCCRFAPVEGTQSQQIYLPVIQVSPPVTCAASGTCNSAYSTSKSVSWTTGTNEGISFGQVNFAASQSTTDTAGTGTNESCGGTNGQTVCVKFRGIAMRQYSSLLKFCSILNSADISFCFDIEANMACTGAEYCTVDNVVITAPIKNGDGTASGDYECSNDCSEQY